MRAAAKRLQHDPSPLVRANARHVEEDAWELASLEALHDWTAEHNEGARAITRRLQQRGFKRKEARRRWHAEADISLSEYR